MPASVKSQKKSQKKNTVLSLKSKRKTKAPTDQDFQEMIAEAAYYKAEQRGFVPGFEEEDWFQAEYEIMSMVKNH